MKDWYTIKDIADMCGVSKQAVEYQIKVLGLDSFKSVQGNRKIFPKEQANQLIEHFKGKVCHQITKIAKNHQKSPKAFSDVDTGSNADIAFYLKEISESLKAINARLSMFEGSYPDLKETNIIVKDTSEKITKIAKNTKSDLQIRIEEALDRPLRSSEKRYISLWKKQSLDPEYGMVSLNDQLFRDSFDLKYVNDQISDWQSKGVLTIRQAKRAILEKTLVNTEIKAEKKAAQVSISSNHNGSKTYAEYVCNSKCHKLMSIIQAMESPHSNEFLLSTVEEAMSKYPEAFSIVYEDTFEYIIKLTKNKWGIHPEKLEKLNTILKEQGLI